MCLKYSSMCKNRCQCSFGDLQLKFSLGGKILRFGGFMNGNVVHHVHLPSPPTSMNTLRE